MRRGPGRLASGLQLLQRRTAQLSRLADEERHTVARIAALERVLDFDRVAAHVRGAVRVPALERGPVPHLSVSHVLPVDVYQVLVESIPADVFFDERAPDLQELRVPPRVAPTSSIVAWMFMTEILREVLGPALLERFDAHLAACLRERIPTVPLPERWSPENTLAESRIVRRSTGSATAAPERPWEFLTGTLDLDPAPGRNSLLAFVGSQPPESSPRDGDRYTYEFGIGPTREARRSFAAQMGKAG